MRRIHFFALKRDIENIVGEVESNQRIVYTKTANSLSSDAISYERGVDIPGLGTASHHSAVASDSFLVSLREQRIKVRESIGDSGVSRYLIDQLVNPDTVVLTPAGLWGAEILLHGRVATVSDSAMSQKLMQMFYRAIGREFTKINMFWVGPAALDFWKAGHRLTAAVQSPSTYDLRPRPSGS